MRRKLSAAVWLLSLASCLGEMGEEGSPQIPPPGNSAGTGVTDLPCDVETVLATRCWSCHGQTPAVGLPSLTSVAAFMAASRTDPSQSIGMLVVARMQSTTTPMPPPPGARATAGEIAVISAWVASGYQAGAACGGAICTSGATWTGGNRESPLMNPGTACIQCHDSGNEAPRFSIAGTVYPTVHEPDLCNGSSAAGVQIVITGADGRTLTLSLNSAGNFFSQIAVALPYQAAVITAAGERAMTARQTSGDCNGCHTQAGANGAPGRIMVP